MSTCRVSQFDNAVLVLVGLPSGLLQENQVKIIFKYMVSLNVKHQMHPVGA